MNPETKKVKIVATIGPATNTKEMLTKLAERGVNVFRLNLSHKDREEMIRDVENIRAVEKELGTTLSIMGDLGGPKIRTSTISSDKEAVFGDIVEITTEQMEIGTADKFSLNFPEIVHSLEVGAEVYLNDGMPKLEVFKKNKDSVLARVVVPGTIKSRMGFSAQGLAINKFELTEKDKHDIGVMLEAGADALAISFVQTAEDVENVKALLPQDKPPMLIAKIETMAGVKNAEAILDVADGLMVARGDLGFAVPLGDIPHIQKKLIAICLHKAKPVITATQMLESMTFSHLPTRAEITDVANAILDGTDAVMLSGETARGKYPEEVIRTMVKIIDKALPHIEPREFKEQDRVSDAVGSAVAKVADQVKARLIIVFTHTGTTARRIARHRHGQQIIAVSPYDSTLHALSFSWGVTGKKIENLSSFDDLLRVAREIAAKNNLVTLKAGEPFVISAGVPFGKSGTTNMVLVQQL